MNVVKQKKHNAGRSTCIVLGRELGTLRKELLFVIVLVILCAVVILYALLSGRGTRARIIKEGDAAPPFTLQTTKQTSLALSDYRGKVVLVHFWATWCPPCVEELPQLEKLYRTLLGKDFEILAVNVDDDAERSVTPFLAKNRVSFPVLFDPGGAVARKYGTIKFPETYVLDRGGNVRYKVIGPLEWTLPETSTAIQRMISER